MDYTSMSPQDRQTALLGQIVNITTFDGSSVSFALSDIDDINQEAISSTLSFGAELGVSIAMLAVVLLMTPWKKLQRAANYVAVASLVFNIFRTALLSVFWLTSWAKIYTLFSGDYEFVTGDDFRASIVADLTSLPQQVLIVLSLMLQAWVMVRLWQDVYKWTVGAASLLLVLVAFGFKCADQAMQIRTLYPDVDLSDNPLWLKYTSFILDTVVIVWFCLLFNVKLVSHMWTRRSFLPTTNGLSPMDVLVVSSGFMMIIPVFFAGLQFGPWPFQAGSWVYTSIAAFLPLGSLVAQRIANPSAFDSSLKLGATAQSGVSNNSKKPILASYDEKNTKSITSNNSKESDDEDNSVSAMVEGNSGAAASKVEKSKHMDAIEAELAKIDAGDFDAEMGKGVRVDHEFSYKEEHS